MAEKSRYWSPDRTYELELKIGNVDLTPDLIEFKILTSLELPYQNFELNFYLDPNDIIAEKIYGQTPIKVTVKLLATSQYTEDRIEFELMYLSSNMKVATEIANPSNRQKERMPIRINAVARNAYITMNTYVNSIYQGSTIKAAIDDLVSKTNATLKYDNNGQNKELIDQILVPPSTLYKNLQYLNRTFGLFDGMTSFYCSHDNKIYVKNITNKMLQAQTFTVYQLALDLDNTDTFKKCTDGKHFYTIRDVHSKYEANSVFAFMAPEIIYVVKPRDRLEKQLTIDLEEFAKDYGLISKNDRIFFDKTAIKTDTRKTIQKDHTGYELTESFIKSNLSKRISDITDISVIVEQSIKILNLMNVGDSVEFTTPTVTTSNISGRYILKTSEIRFNKLKDWETSAVLSLMRTNRTLI